MKDFDLSKTLNRCPSDTMVILRELDVKPIVRSILKMIIDSVPTSEKIVIKESSLYGLSITSFCDKSAMRYVFSHLMAAVGEYYKDDPNISVGYYKPEIDGKIEVMFIVRNLNITRENELRNSEMKEMKNRINEMRGQIKTLSK